MPELHGVLPAGWVSENQRKCRGTLRRCGSEFSGSPRMAQTCDCWDCCRASVMLSDGTGKNMICCAMPITTFSSFADGLDPARRSREHFIANTNLNENRLWVPYADGVWLQPCCFNVTSGGFSVILKGLPGAGSELTTTSARSTATQCEVTGDTWSTTGLPTPEPTSMNPRG